MKTDPDLMTVREVAALFRVKSRTVARWDATLHPYRTPSGQRRYLRRVVEDWLKASGAPDHRPPQDETLDLWPGGGRTSDPNPVD